jgi:hypothetical protein
MGSELLKLAVPPAGFEPAESRLARGVLHELPCRRATACPASPKTFSPNDDAEYVKNLLGQRHLLSTELGGTGLQGVDVCRLLWLGLRDQTGYVAGSLPAEASPPMRGLQSLAGNAFQANQ